MADVLNRTCQGVALGAFIGVAVGMFPAVADEALGGDMVVTKGMKPWEGCGECHDLDGIAPNGHFPNLAAQKASYIRKQMDDFRAGRRGNDHGQMGTSAREVSGAALDQVVEYFSGLPPPPVPVGGSNSDAPGRAKLLVEKGSRAEKIPPCTNCHSPNPKRAFDAPWIASQQAAYLVKELEDFRDGRRTNDPHGVMQKVAKLLSDDDFQSIATYLMSLPRPTAQPDRVAGAARHTR